MADVTDIVKRLSGGAAESDPDLALGGVMSTVGIDSQTAVYPTSTIAGVTLVEGLGHSSEGTGTLTFAIAGTTLVWNPASGLNGAPVDVSIDGRYAIKSAAGNEYIIVDVVAASLPGGNTAVDVDINNIQNNLFDDISNLEAALGETDYRCFYVLNDAGAGTALNVRVWITQQPGLSPTMFSIGLDPVGIGDGSATGVAVTIANEDTAPVGVVFTAPVTEGTALMIGNLTPGDVQAVWIRRTVPTNTLQDPPEDPGEVTIGVSF